MGRKSTIIDLRAEDREYLEAQTRARTIQAQTVNRARIHHQHQMNKALHLQLLAYLLE